MANPKHPNDTQMVYCHEGNEHVARVTASHPETGEVTGLAVYDETGLNIAFGVTDPKPATTPQHRITHGHFWKR